MQGNLAEFCLCFAIWNNFKYISADLKERGKKKLPKISIYIPFSFIFLANLTMLDLSDLFQLVLYLVVILLQF